MSIIIKSFDQLSPKEVYDCLKLRQDVFILEQTCLYPDIDGQDLNAQHVMFYRQAALLGYARIMHDDEGVRIGRVIAKVRHQGIGEQVMKAALQWICATYPGTFILLHAQTYAIGFYQKQNFVAEGDVFEEDGIPHIKMVYQKSSL